VRIEIHPRGPQKSVLPMVQGGPLLGGLATHGVLEQAHSLARTLLIDSQKSGTRAIISGPSLLMEKGFRRKTLEDTLL